MMEDLFFFFCLVVVLAIQLGVLQIQWSGLQFPHFTMIESLENEGTGDHSIQSEAPQLQQLRGRK
jgi:hypothetical protein